MAKANRALRRTRNACLRNLDILSCVNSQSLPEEERQKFRNTLALTLVNLCWSFPAVIEAGKSSPLRAWWERVEDIQVESEEALLSLISILRGDAPEAAPVAPPTLQ